MLRPRIIPLLLIHNRGLVKTIKFNNGKYVGDPLNAVKIFNEKEVDELTVFDIDASALGKEPNYELIQKMAAQCRMPLCYGGGIKNLRQAEKLLSYGVEKIALSSVLAEKPEIVRDIALNLGNQSVVAVLDIKKDIFGNYKMYTINGKNKTDISIHKLIDTIQNYGVGEIVLNSINHDGTGKGYDLLMVEKFIKDINVPLTIVGGAGSDQDMINLIKKFGIIGVCAGSRFVFKGKYKAVLINYPTFEEKNSLLKSSGMN